MLSKGLKGLFSKEDVERPVQKDIQTNLFFSNNAPTWEELDSLAKKKGSELGDPSLVQVCMTLSCDLYKICNPG